ncbi:hypothetical protein [Streptomyces sp. DH37]|uniref:hypothetical protein n=1 Tax=Streptomyces sp. DH37 TaxID=3040122 RepID=UPI0024424B2C|nr:hypothetical protein [Streptomyces sp. DH37]MDG9703775.1 hypothetical protein [Streptomyces sp. DH37]
MTRTTPPPDDWWTRLYGADDTPAPAPVPAAAGRPVGGRTGAQRIPDWRTGPLLDLSPADPDTDPKAAPVKDSAPHPDPERTRTRTRTREDDRTRTRPEEELQPDEDGTPRDEEGEREEEEHGLPPWDPTAIAGHLVHLYRQRPAQERVQEGVHVVQRIAQQQRRIGPAVYTATGVYAAWKLGFTPWLIGFMDGAPVGVSLLAVWLGWGVYRTADQAVLPVAWCGRALYTATVLAVALQP